MQHLGPLSPCATAPQHVLATPCRAWLLGPPLRRVPVCSAMAHSTAAVAAATPHARAKPLALAFAWNSLVAAKNTSEASFCGVGAGARREGASAEKRRLQERSKGTSFGCSHASSKVVLCTSFDNCQPTDATTGPNDWLLLHHVRCAIAAVLPSSRPDVVVALAHKPALTVTL